MKVFQPLYAVASVLLVAFAGWTASTHAVVLHGAGLDDLLLLAPLVIGAFVLVHVFLSTARGGAAFAVPVPIARDEANDVSPTADPHAWLFLALCVGAMVALTLWVNRSDLDDAFYAAVASNALALPSEPLLATDPMSGEPGWPLLFHSYRYSSFEVLVAAVARVSGRHPLDVYYVFLPALMAACAAIAPFILGRMLLPKHWVAVGVTTLLAALLMGEMHRSPANFSFVRLYQGKAVFVSVLLPMLYAATHRLLSPEGRPQDVWVLACGVLSAVGMTNFGMLVAPMAVGTAMLSNGLAFRNIGWRRFALAGACALVALPYLFAVVMHAKGSALLVAPYETPGQVLLSVLGKSQLYLGAVLLCSGPVLARDTRTRWRLAVPLGVLFLVLLNPWLSRWVATHVTTPAVYWRVTWSVPLLVLMACGWVLVWERALEGKGLSLARLWAAAVLVLLVVAVPFHTLRSGNAVTLGPWAQWKIPASSLAVARTAISEHQGGGRLLAPDDIAGVITRFPQHPPLVSVREHYLDLLGTGLTPDALIQRKVLHAWVTGQVAQENIEPVLLALDALCVTTIVMPSLNAENHTTRRLIGADLVRVLSGYEVWTRRCGHHPSAVEQ